ncbi:primosomal protein N', partial [TM7 phylum sp. oral taxon 353]
PKIILTHSKQTEAQRHAAWKEIINSNDPVIVIGPRSALFAPVQQLGLIVIDECHEPSFKQEQSPRYSALRAASVLARQHNAKLILGSATPAVADYYLAKHSNSAIASMNTPARTDAVKPSITLVDMTKRQNFSEHQFLSNPLLKSLRLALKNNRQALIFHNRRGTAAVTLCESCGWQAGCPRCFVPLTLHADKHQLSCHICSFSTSVPTSCPECHNADIIHKGIGTKRIESELKKLFLNKKIVRFDGDSTPEETVDAQYDKLKNGDIDIIIGTQVIAKGLDLPNLGVVGVVQADAGLLLPDYVAAERTFQLLAQVVGRVGRSHNSTEVIVQTYHPSHPSIVDGLRQNYADFYKRTIAQRQKTNFPPFVYLLKLTCTYKTEKSAVNNAQKIAQLLKAKSPDIEILGPTPAFYERVRDTYRWQIIVKSPQRRQLINLIKYIPPAHWQYELDSISLL